MTPAPSLPQNYLTTVELADKLRVQPATIRKWVRAGVIPVVRIKKKVLRFDADAVVAALAAAQGQGVARGE